MLVNCKETTRGARDPRARQNMAPARACAQTLLRRCIIHLALLDWTQTIRDKSNIKTPKLLWWFSLSSHQKLKLFIDVRGMLSALYSGK